MTSQDCMMTSQDCPHDGALPHDVVDAGADPAGDPRGGHGGAGHP